MNQFTPLRNDPFPCDISREIWEKKYRFQSSDGTQDDETVEGTWRRIADALAEPEAEAQLELSNQFYSALENFKFMPAGRITSGAGTGRRVTLSNCFVMGTIPDSMEGIFDMLKEAALTMQQGGGIGYDFSTIRPKGTLVKGVDSDASGPLSFMDVWDAMCRTIMSAGSRRGAMMATMRCDHPDILDFVTAKHDAARLRMFNMSVLVTDSFMECVKDGHMWELTWNGEVISEIPARELWDTIMQSTYDYAEPGVIFIDRVNEDHNLNYMETVSATNPCGEKPMAPYSSCLLGSINLARLVKHPFTMKAGIDVRELEDLVATAIRMMDNVIDVGAFPLEKQAEKALEDRQLGLGVTGLADALAMLRMKYGSPEAVNMTKVWMQVIRNAAYKASIDLAALKGSFTAFDAEKIMSNGAFVTGLPEDLKAGIAAYGLRNSLLLSIAPTGTISLYGGNVSSGIEPIFANSYQRRILNPDGSESFQTVEDYAVALYREYWIQNTAENRAFDVEKDLPDYFVNAQTLTPEDHVVMQAAVQEFVDSSISKTVNLPADISFEDFKDVYMQAYDKGCKGCTTYRPNDVTGAVLSVEPKAEPEDEPVKEEISGTSPTTLIMDRPDELPGATYKLKWPGNPHALYVTLSDIQDADGLRPFEIFINSKNMEHYAWIVALTRMISAVFRRGGDVAFVVEELKAVFDPRGGAWMKGEYVPSMLAAIGNVIEQHMRNIGYISPSEPANLLAQIHSDIEPERVTLKSCSACGAAAVTKEGGCEVCKACGHSACG